MLFITSALLFSAIIFSFDRFSKDYLIYFITLLGVLGHVFFPIWFLQGVERMEFVSIFTILFRSLSVILIFVFVKTEAHLITYVLINSGYFFILGIISFLFVRKYFNLNIVVPNRYQLIRQLKKGWYIFLSTLSINLYTTSNTFLLGLLAGNEAVGFFAAANKIKEAINGLLSNFGRTVFPHLSMLFSASKNKAIEFVKKYRKIVIGLALLASVLLFVFAEVIISLVVGSNYSNSISALRILAFLPFIIMISNLYGIQIMLNLGFNKKFNKIITSAAILNLIAMFMLVPFLLEDGAALAMLGTEIFVTLGMYQFVKSKRLLEQYEI
jgi:PST family polysaccharide transporter